MNAIKKLGSLILVLAISLPYFAKKKVELIGRWDLKTKSITFQLPVQTWVQDNNKDLGNYIPLYTTPYSNQFT